MVTKDKKADNIDEPKFTKSQWLKSSKFAGVPDLVTCSLEDGKYYSSQEVEKAIDAFIKGGI